MRGEWYSWALIYPFLIKVGSGADLCYPNCQDLPNGSLVPDPTNCTRYYGCVDNGSGMSPSLLEECPSGTFFDAWLDTPLCKPIDDAPTGYCENPCSPCGFDCSTAGTLHPDPLDCSSYYVCLADSEPLSVICELPTPFFDYLTLECSGFADGCYTFCEECSVQCTEQGTKLPDPESCEHYYDCQPPYKTREKCPDQQNFDPYTKMCSPNVVCTHCPWD